MVKVDIEKLKAEIFSGLCGICSKCGLHTDIQIESVRNAYSNSNGVEIGHIDLCIHKLEGEGKIRAKEHEPQDDPIAYFVEPDAYTAYLISAE